MTNEQMRREELEDNVRRLFGRLEKRGLALEDAHDRILGRLLREASPPQPRRAGPGVARRLRWVGLAAVILLGTVLLTGDLFRIGDSPWRASSTEDAGTATTEPHGPVMSFAIHLMARGPGPAVVEAASADGGEPVPILPERYVSNADVESARVERVDNRCQVSIRLTPEGTARLARLTRDHIGDQLALVLDGQVVMTPTIRSEITQGPVLLTGDFSDARCSEIARGLSPGH